MCHYTHLYHIHAWCLFLAALFMKTRVGSIAIITTSNPERGWLKITLVLAEHVALIPTDPPWTTMHGGASQCSPTKLSARMVVYALKSWISCVAALFDSQSA